MRKFFVSLISLAVVVGSYAYEVSGIVTDEKNTPIEFANITAFRSGSVVGSAVSDEAGRFIIEVGNSCDSVRVSYGGYNDTVVSRVPARLGTISLTSPITTLKEVVIKAPLFSREADRIVMNVNASPLNANKNAKDLLKIAPGVWADDKDLSIYGKNNVAVYIDEHKVNLSGIELMNYLKTVQSSAIGTIEILPQGGAEYSADYTGGIILIKLKRNRVDGIIGSAGLNYTTGEYKQWLNPIANVSIHSGKWTFNLNGSANGCPSERSTGYSDYWNSAISKTMNNVTYYKNNAIQANAMAGIFYEATDRDKLGLQFDYNYSNTHHINISHTLTSGGDTDCTTNGNYKHRDVFHNFDATFNWRHDLAEDGSELKLIANYNYQSTSVRENNEMTWSYLASDSVYATNNRSLYSILTVDFSFKKVLNPKWTLNAGAKYTHNGVNNRSLHTYLNENVWWNNSRFDFDDNYQENIGALYIMSNGSVDRWKFKVGIRGEYYSSRGFMVRRDKVDLFPNANIGFDITDNGDYNLSLGYYRNIYRPTFQSLNPISVQSSDYFYLVGNPELSACYTNSMSLSFILNHRFTVAMGYGNTRNPIRQMITSNPDYPERMYLTWENMGKESQVYIHADGFINLTRWWNFYASATYNIMSQKLSNADAFDTFGYLQLIGSTSITLPWDVNISVSCFYNTKRKQGNLTFYPMLFITPRIEKQFGKHWILTFGAEDMLQRMSRFKNSSNGYDVVSYSRSHIALNLGVTYNFTAGKGFNSRNIENNSDNSRLFRN